MDDKSLNLTAESILQKVFKQNVKGYDPDEVDTFLDRVIADYRAYDKYIQDAQAYIQSLETKLRKLQDDNRDQTVDLALAKARVQGIKDNGDANESNIRLLQYIDRLERALYKKGVDPTTLQY